MKGNMAGNKPTAKVKNNKEERVKSKKNCESNSNSCNGSSEETTQVISDLSVLTKSIPTNIVGFRNLIRLYDNATEEVQSLLANECDFIYECRVCRNMFRSIANFISHKRAYCKQKFNTTLHAHFVTTSFLNNDTCEIYTNNKLGDECSVKSNISSNKKDLASIINKLGQNVPNKNLNLLEYYNEINYRVEQKDALKSEHAIRFDDIDNNKSAVYQTIVKKDDYDTNEEFIIDEVIELHDMLWKDNAVMGPDGKLLALDSSGQIISPRIICSKNVDDEEEILKCDICCLEFKTRKTLLYHIKVKHSTSHMHYPCPSCSDIFPSAGSVYRHLCKVHNNTMVTIRKLRDQILNRGFTMDSASKKMLHRMNKQGEDALTKQEPQDENYTWMFDFDVDALHCTGCGRKFERKAALTSHQLICKNRTQLQAKYSTNINKKSEDITEKNTKNVRKSKVPSKKIKNNKENNISTEDNIIAENDEQCESSDTENEPSKIEKNGTCNVVIEENNSGENEQTNIDSNIEHKKNKRKRSHTTKIITDSEKVSTDLYWELNEQGLLSVKRSKTEAVEEDEMKKKMFSLINEKKMQCIPCKKVFPSMTNLKRHIALHMKWKRFQCGLCCSQFYHRSECLYHLGRSHNMMGDKNFADTLIIPIYHKEVENYEDKPISFEDEIICNSEDDNKLSNELPKTNIDLAIDEVVLKYTDFDNEELNENVHSEAASKLDTKESDIGIINTVNALTEEIKEESIELAPVKKRGRPKLPLSERINDEEDTREKRGRGRPRGSFNKETKKKIKQAKVAPETMKSDNNEKQPQDSDKMRKMVLEVIFGGEKKEDKQGEAIEKTEIPSSPETDISCVSNDFEMKTKFEKTDDVSDKRSSRPVRNRVRVVNKDFVYDLSDLLKKEAEAYKESHYTSTCSKIKKRVNSVAQLEETNKSLENASEVLPVSSNSWDNSCTNQNEYIPQKLTPKEKTVANETITICDEKEIETDAIDKSFTEKLFVSKPKIDNSRENYKHNDPVEDITVIPINISNNSADESSGSSDEMPMLEVNMSPDIDSNDEEMNDPLDVSVSSSDESTCPDITETYKSNYSPLTCYANSDASRTIHEVHQLQNKSEVANRFNRVYIRKSTGDLEEFIFESSIESNEESVIYEPMVNGVANDGEYGYKNVEYINENIESIPLECNSTLGDTSSEEETDDSD